MRRRHVTPHDEPQLRASARAFCGWRPYRLPVSVFDDAAAQTHVAIVEHRRLPWCDGPLRVVEIQFEEAIRRRRSRSKRARRIRLPVAVFAPHAKPSAGGSPATQLVLPALSVWRAAMDGRALHDVQRVRRHILARDEPRLAAAVLAAAEADAFALSERIEREADVFADTCRRGFSSGRVGSADSGSGIRGTAVRR